MVSFFGRRSSSTTTASTNDNATTNAAATTANNTGNDKSNATTTTTTAATTGSRTTIIRNKSITGTTTNRSNKVTATNDTTSEHDNNDIQFSSTKCPPGSGLENACQLPFGFTYTPLVNTTSTQTSNNNDNNNNNKNGGTKMLSSKSLELRNHHPTKKQSTTTATVVVQQPDICLTCLSYRNQYSKIVISNTTNPPIYRWTCTICGQDQNELLLVQNPMNDDGGKNHHHHHEITTSTYEFHQRIGDTDNSNTTASSASAEQYLVIVMDQNLPSSEAHSIITSLQRTIGTLVQQTPNIIIHLSLVLFGKSLSIYQLGVGTTTTASADQVSSITKLSIDKLQQRCYTITIDGSSTTSVETLFQPVLTCIDAFYGTISSSDVTTAASALSVGTSSSKFDSTNDPTIPIGQKSRLEMLKERKEARMRLKQQTATSSEQQQLEENTETSTSTQHQFSWNGTTKPAMSSSDSSVSSQSPWIIAHERQKAKNEPTRKPHFDSKQHQPLYGTIDPPYRCTGEAIECALELISVLSSTTTSSSSSSLYPGLLSSQRDNISQTGRIVLFTNGCPNYGSGSCTLSTKLNSTTNDPKYTTKLHDNSVLYNTVHPKTMARICSDYYEVLGKNGYEYGIGIDVFCSGTTNDLGMPVYQCLVEPSSGYVTVVDSFASNQHQFVNNLQYILLHTYLAVGQYDSRYDNLLAGTDVESNDEDVNDTDTLSSWMNGCIVDIRLSSFVTPTHLIGPGDLLEKIPNAGPLPNEHVLYNRHAALVNNPELLQQQQLTTGQDDTEGKGTTILLKKKKKITVTISELMLESSLTRIRLGRYDPRSTFSMMMRLNDFYQQKHDQFVYIQCIVRYMNRDSTILTTRISTYQLPIAKTVPEFVQSVNSKVVPVLLAKEAIYRSMFGRDNAATGSGGFLGLIDDDDTAAPLTLNGIDPATLVHVTTSKQVGIMDMLAYEAQRDLDETIFRISRSYRLLCLEMGGVPLPSDSEEGDKVHSSVGVSATSINIAFPPRLSDALRRLYHLRRGPLLSPGPLQSMDNRTCIRSQFLRLPLEDCYAMLAPVLWSCSVPSANTSSTSSVSNGTEGIPYMENVPAETLALWSNRIIAADYYYSAFIWSGKDVDKTAKADRVRNHLHKFLLDRSVDRFPMSETHILNENDSMSRRFTSLLSPSHGDPVEYQLAHFPSITQLSETEQQQLRSKFSVYDPIPDPSFRTWFWNVTSATGTKDRDVGQSLCD